jgi:hypothetical protein
MAAIFHAELRQCEAAILSRFIFAEPILALKADGLTAHGNNSPAGCPASASMAARSLSI